MGVKLASESTRSHVAIYLRRKRVFVRTKVSEAGLNYQDRKGYRAHINMICHILTQSRHSYWKIGYVF